MTTPVDYGRFRGLRGPLSRSLQVRGLQFPRIVVVVSLVGVLGCFDMGKGYIVEGTVVRLNSPTEVVLDHEAVPALHMDAMVMPFIAKDPALLADLKPGDHVQARFDIEGSDEVLLAVRVDGHGPPPTIVQGPGPLHPGDTIPHTEVPTSDGSVVILGSGQSKAVALSFVYTRCPLPNYCPATIARLQALQGQIGTDATILAVTMDPAYDTPSVLKTYADQAGAKPETWKFGRLDKPALDTLVSYAALSITKDGDTIVHGLRLLILDKDGKLVERYDDNRWSMDRVVQQLRTGAPAAPAGSNGTLTPAP
jgi:protein SCO1/2